MFALVVGCSAAPGPEPAELTESEVAALTALANPPPPPPDHSNRYVQSDAAAELGRKLYFDPRFSGPATHEDTLRRSVVIPGLPTLGEPTGLSCNTCHDVTRAAGESGPRLEGVQVAVGGGVYDVSGQQTKNAAYYPLLYWNGRNDSLWSQIVAVTESPVSMAGSRLAVAWRIADAYREEYESVFAGYPLPLQFDSSAAQRQRLLPDGSCKLIDGACPSEHCHLVTAPGGEVCAPRFPLAGRPGFIELGQLPVCDYGSSDPLSAPNGDAYECMEVADQLLVTRIYVNFAKAIAAYEYRLESKDSDFDRWVSSGFREGMPSASAVRGAQLFVGKAGCSHCHSGPLLSDGAFHNIGVPQAGAYVPRLLDCPPGGWCDCMSDDTRIPTNCLPWGYRDGLRKLQANRFRRDSRWSDDLSCQNRASLHTDLKHAKANPDECDGRVIYYATPLADSFKGAWRTPSLRDVALTAPYMHSGQYATLEEVIEHYDRAGRPIDGALGGELVGEIGRSMIPLDLSAGERADLVAFLRTLNGRSDERWTSPPVLPD